MEVKKECLSCSENLKNTKRTEIQIKALKNRLNRIIGQIQGIESMIENQRYCKDVLIQVSAVEKAIKSVGMEILREHLSTCVVEKIQAGQTEIVDETIDLVKKL